MQDAAHDHLVQEIAVEQAHVDRVYAELDKAADRARLLQSEGLSRGRTDRVGDVRDEEMAGLFERDALVFNAARRVASLETQHEGLVFGRLDIEHTGRAAKLVGPREARYVGRLGVRDADYEPLVIDWRAPAAAAFYQATPVQPMGVLRRRVLRCRGDQVVGVEDDLMVAEAPDDLVVLGDGALMAALTRSRGGRMRDIVATIQAHQDEAIRAAPTGVTTITGGPGTGKTVVALHRAAYLLYSNRRRFESGGVLVVGPSAAYTAYIERVLPSLGEDSVALRSVGDLVDAMTATRVDTPAVAAIKGSLRMRRVLSRAAGSRVPDAPTELRTMVAGLPVRLDVRTLDRLRTQVVRQQPRNSGYKAAAAQLADAAWSSVRSVAGTVEREEFYERFTDHLDVDAFLRAWWAPVDAREVVLWLADDETARRCGRGVLTDDEARELAASMRVALDTGQWSVADVALVDDVLSIVGVAVPLDDEERGFYEIEELDSLAQYGVQEVGAARTQATPRASVHPTAARERLLAGALGEPGEYAHILVDEAQDLSPMQWRALGRRGEWASWTIVGDLTQASWPDLAEAATAQDDAWGSKPRQHFHMSTNYRNAREIFEYARDVITREVPDADIPDAVRETGVQPVEAPLRRVDDVAAAARQLLDVVDGPVAVVAPDSWRERLALLGPDLGLGLGARVLVIDPLSTKGLEWDATVVVDPEAISRETAGGVRTLYVVLTRAAHRTTVLRP